MGRLLVVVAAVTLSACGLFANDDGTALCPEGGAAIVGDCVSIGIGLPAADLRRGYDLDYRCPGGDPCFREAQEALLAALDALGEPYQGQREVLAAGAEVPLRVEFQPSPAIRWLAAGNRTGMADHVSVDLTLLAIGDGPAFAVVGPDFATDAAYVVPDGPAFAILDALFTRADE
jgi:hypothetical protein